MLTYPMEERGALPLYEYLCRRIRADILSGVLPAGTRLPSKRALAEHLRVSVVTVEGAYSQLEAEGYLQARPKRGFFVSAVEQAPPPAVRSVLMPETTTVSWRLDPVSYTHLDVYKRQVGVFPDSVVVLIRDRPRRDLIRRRSLRPEEQPLPQPSWQRRPSQPEPS